MGWFQYGGVTPAQAQSSAQFHAGSLPQYVPNNGWLGAVAAAAQQISPAIKTYLDQKHLDEIGDAVRQMNAQSDAGQQAVNPLRGQEYLKAQQMFQAMQEQKQADTPDTVTDDQNYDIGELKKQLLQKKIDSESGASGPSYINTPYGVMTAHQWSLDPRNPDRPAAPDALAGAVPLARGKLDAQGNFTNAYTGAESGDRLQLQIRGGKKIDVPYATWANRQQPQSTAQAAFAGAQNNEGDTTDEPNSTPPQDKPLDSSTAAKILAQAGGDKDKAREIAKQLGYTF